MKAKHSLFLLYFAALLISLGHTLYASEAADPIRGRITAGINLRAAPGLAGKVITGLEPGIVVTITGEQSGWYQIAYEDETYGYRGWVYGRYLEKLSTVPAATAAPAAVVEKHSPGQALTPVPVPEPPPAQRSSAGDTLPPPVDMPTNTIELIQAAAAPQAVPAQAPVPPVVTAAKPPAHPAAETENRVQAPPVKMTPDRDTTTRTGPGNLLSVVLKISSVFLSCLALMISYRTFQLVTASTRTS